MLSSAPKKTNRIIVYTKALLIAASLSYLCLYTPKLFELENFSRDFSINYNAATIVKRGLSEKLYDLESRIRHEIENSIEIELPEIEIELNHIGEEIEREMRKLSEELKDLRIDVRLNEVIL